VTDRLSHETLVGVLDVGIGNVESVVNALLQENILAESVETYREDKHAVLVLPGVGHWSRMQQAVIQSDLMENLAFHLQKGGALVGICLGMQILGRKSAEGPGGGLSVLDFEVTDICQGSGGPNIGWAEVQPSKDFERQEDASGPFYFMHDYGLIYSGQDFVKSYYLNDSGTKVAAEIRSGNVAGFQFHPERSLAQGRHKLAQTIRDMV